MIRACVRITPQPSHSEFRGIQPHLFSTTNVLVSPSSNRSNVFELLQIKLSCSVFHSMMYFKYAVFQPNTTLLGFALCMICSSGNNLFILLAGS